MGFDQSKCIFSECRGECLTRCPYISYDEGRAKEAIRTLIAGGTAPILTECITCAACNDFCPLGANPWDLIAWRQEETGIPGIPEDAKPSSDWLTKPEMVIRGKKGGPLISMGGIFEVVPQVEFLTGKMFKGATLIGGGKIACGFTETHLGRSSRHLTFLPEFIANLTAKAKKYKVDEIVFTHDACYNVATTIAMREHIGVPFQPVHILEYIRNWLLDNPDQITPLNVKVAVQGGCTTRYAPVGGDHEIWSDWLADIFYLIGVESVEDRRTYRGDDRLCCGLAIFDNQRERATGIQQRNIQDAILAGAERFVFICPICISIMRTTCRKMNLNQST